MHVFLFQPRFIEAVRDGTKLCTIRARKHLPVPREQLSLRHWSGAPYRSKQVLIREAVCDGVTPVTFTSSRWVIMAGNALSPEEEDDLAADDGFVDSRDMWQWFRETHQLPFSGHIIGWTFL